MKDIYLAHFGILGMKWGVRRFQKEDGTLTEAGKKRKKYYQDIDDDTILVKKGTSAYRFSNADEKLDDKHKYMSVTDYDREQYEELGSAHGLFLDYSKAYGTHVNELTTDLRVKRGETVVKDLIDKYGGKDIDALKQDLERRKDLTKRFEDAKSRSEYIDDLDGVYWEEDDWVKQAQSRDHLDNFITDVMKKHADDVISYYKEQKKYDAIVDPNDWVSNMADMPLIVLNPNQTVKQKDFHRYG